LRHAAVVVSVSVLKNVPAAALIVARRLVVMRRTLGVRGTIVYCAKGLVDLPRRVRLLVDEALYDSETGLETSRLISVADLGIEACKMKVTSTNANGIAYMPTPARAPSEIIAYLGLRYNQYTFIDLGSGMGRVVFAAAAFPFRKVVGVEFSRALHEIAQRNLSRVSGSSVKAGAVELICQDARDYTFPRGNSVVYLFNPFREPVLQIVLANLQQAQATNGGELYVIYYNPVLKSVLDAAPFLTRIRTTREYAVYHGLRSVIG
jgi:hypothetical protein